jgi:hypothetical protein
MEGSTNAYLIGGAIYPSESGWVNKIYKNIEDEPLVRKIKDLEKQLPDNFAKKNSLADNEKQILGELLADFKQLLNVKYGPLGYLVSTSAEDIIHLYGVDTEEDFIFLEGGSSLRVPNPILDRMAGTDNRRWVPARGLLVADPAENPQNMKVTDDAINEIINAIESKLSKFS